MARWVVKVIDEAEREIKDLPKDMQTRFFHVADMLEEFGPQRVGLPHVCPLVRKLWEMRLKGRDGIARAIYFAAKGRQLVVVRVFIKKTQKTPHREIEIARERMEHSNG